MNAFLQLLGQSLVVMGRGFVLNISHGGAVVYRLYQAYPALSLMQLLPLLLLCLNLRMFAASLCVPQGQSRSHKT